MDALVVTGVDDSEPAARAAAAGAQLAVAFGAPLVVVSAFDEASAVLPSDLQDVVPLSAADVAEVVAQNVVDQIRADHPGLEVIGRAVAGRPADVLVKVAEELDATIVVVGNRRVQGITRVLGSVANDLARRVPCDLYIAHTHDRDTPVAD